MSARFHSENNYILGVLFAFLSNSSACSACSACPCDANGTIGDQFGAMFEWTLIIRIKKKNEHQEELEFIRNAITPLEYDFWPRKHPKNGQNFKKLMILNLLFFGFFMRPHEARSKSIKSEKEGVGPSL